MKLQKINWKEADEAYSRGQQAYLDWCKAIAVLYAQGTATQEEIGARYDTSQSGLAQAIAIGQDRRFISITNTPKSTYATYLLTTLPDKEFEEYCKPTTTQAVILEVKRRLAAPPAKKVETATERLDRLGVAECFRPGYKSKSPLMGVPETPKVDPRQWLLTYVRSCSEATLLSLLERVRGIEHPDRGGDHNLSTEVNDLIRRIKNDD